MTNQRLSLLILGSVEDFTTLTKLAVDRGAYTVVADAAVDGEAKKYAHKAYNVNLNDSDSIRQICETEKIDRIITSYSDNLFELMVKYSFENHLPCYCPYSTVRYLRDKILMKEMFYELGIPFSKAQKIKVDQLSKESITLQYPFVLKPLDGWGSRGMFIVNCYNDIENYITTSASFSVASNYVMLEEISEGHEINVQSWIQDGKVYFVNFGDRETSGRDTRNLPYLTRQKYPSVYYDTVGETVRSYLSRIANYVGIKEGPLSMQLFYNNGSIIVGEVAGRFFGMEQGLSIISNNIDRNELLINMIFNPEENLNILKQFKSDNGRYSFGLFIKGKKGIVKDFGNYKEIIDNDCVIDVTTYVKENTTTDIMPWLIKIMGCCESQESADKYADYVYKNLYIPDLKGTNLVTENHLIKY